MEGEEWASGYGLVLSLFTEQKRAMLLSAGLHQVTASAIATNNRDHRLATAGGCGAGSGTRAARLPPASRGRARRMLCRQGRGGGWGGAPARGRGAMGREREGPLARVLLPTCASGRDLPPGAPLGRSHPGGARRDHAAERLCLSLCQAQGLLRSKDARGHQRTASSVCLVGFFRRSPNPNPAAPTKNTRRGNSFLFSLKFIKLNYGLSFNSKNHLFLRKSTRTPKGV